jgi:hypothetical protein
MCAALSPERRLISSPTRKLSVPTPGDAKLTPPGRALAASMNSRRVEPFAAALAPTTPKRSSRA